MTNTPLLPLLGLLGCLATLPVLAKLPAPSDEVTAKAAEAAAKTAHTGKVDGFKLCLAIDRVAGHYLAAAKRSGQAVTAPVETPACGDPGPFSWAPAEVKPPIEAAGAHSPAETAKAPPSSLTPAADLPAKK
ncbi:MAG: hypothetical protein H7242_06975 [Microbacteriaceae bacterium]|nr:hypothetical protein [Burkholderiaceae bacterium]